MRSGPNGTLVILRNRRIKRICRQLSKQVKLPRSGSKRYKPCDVQVRMTPLLA